MITESASWVGLVLADGRYRVIAKLGEGGMGFVYRAHDLRLDNQDVVIKVPRRAMLEDAEFAGRFAREIRSLVRLAHPHIVKVTDAGEHDGLPFAVMQYLSGGSLRDRQQTDPDGSRLALPPEELHAWLPGVAAALDFIHERHHIHRDVKPDNILFDGEGHVYLSDFGVAKVLADEQKPKTVYTGTGMVLGTPQYMAPELIMGERYDGRVDQYALAVTIYELVSGRLPAEGPTPAAILVQQTTNIPVPLAELMPTLPETLSPAVAKALSRDPSDRYPDCTTFAREALEGISTTAATSVPRASGPRSYRVSCPSCRKTIVIRATSQGKRVRCPSCGEVFQAPTVSKPVRTGTASAVSETGRAEAARVDTSTGATADPPMVSAAGAADPDSFGSFGGESGDDLALNDYSLARRERGSYLFLAISMAVAVGLLGVLALVFSGAWGSNPTARRDVPDIKSTRPNRPDKPPPEPVPPPPAPNPTPIGTVTQLHSSQNPSEDRQWTTYVATVKANDGKIPDGNVQFHIDGEKIGKLIALQRGRATFAHGLPAGNYTIGAIYMGNGNFTTSASEPLTQAVNERPVVTPEPQPIPVKPTPETPELKAPDERLKGMMTRYIRSRHQGPRLRFEESNHPPRRAKRGGKEGLCYKVEVSFMGLKREFRYYYVFVVNDECVDCQFTNKSWEGVTICEILDK